MSLLVSELLVIVSIDIEKATAHRLPSLPLSTRQIMDGFVVAIEW
jgi:hypothetical protein